jgi:hypothetical protein
MRKGDRAILAQEQRVGDAGLAESTRAQQAAITAPARRPILDRIVTAVGQAVIEPQRDAGSNHDAESVVEPECIAKFITEPFPQSLSKPRPRATRA